MSKYTTQVRYICEFYSGLKKSEGGLKVDDIIDKSIEGVFDFSFPIFDLNYRKTLCKKILKHFYTREIGLETVGLWKLKLNTKLNEIMPFYNQLYKSELIKFNPLYNVEIKTSSNKKFDENEKNKINQIEKSETDIGDEQNKSNTENSKNVEMYNDNIETVFNENDKTIYDNTNLTEYNIDDSKVFDSNETNQYNSSNSTKYGKKESNISANSSVLNETNNNSGENLSSDTPQGSVSDLKGGKYLTNATIVSDDSTKKTTSENHENVDTETSGTDSVTKGGSDSLIKSGSDTNKKTGNESTKKSGNDTFEKSGSNTEKKSGDDTSTNVLTSIEKLNKNENQITNKDIKSDNKKEIKNIEDYIENVIGKNSGDSYSKMLLEFRNTFLNVDLLIIDELEELFMLLW